MLVEIFESDMVNGSKFSAVVLFQGFLPDWYSWDDYIDAIKKTEPRGRKPYQISSGWQRAYMLAKDEIHSLIEMFDYQFSNNINFPPKASKPMPIEEHIGRDRFSACSNEVSHDTGCLITMDINEEDLVNMVLAASTDLQIEFVEIVKKVVNLKNSLAIHR